MASVERKLKAALAVPFLAVRGARWCLLHSDPKGAAKSGREGGAAVSFQFRKHDQ
jgi:hypothetical protein